jgi:hypothetical protein
MTPLRLRNDAARNTVLARSPPFSHGAVIANVNWLTLGTSRCRRRPPVLHGCLDLQASRRSIGLLIGICFPFAALFGRHVRCAIVQAVDDELRPVTG